MILNSTKYKNPERTITGLVNFVSNADTIILCDTSAGVVGIELLEIPNDQWNTTYKLYIADISNNASVNNITINAPVGFTINNQSSLVISTNGGAVVIRVASNTGYLGSLTGGTGNPLAVLNQGVQITPSATSMNFVGLQASAIGTNVTINNAFISLDFVTLQALISGGDLIPNQAYNVTDAVFGRNSNKHNVYVTATANNQISTSGLGQFYNADYDNIGNYSGVTGFVSQTGLWQSSLFYIVGNVVIWDNLHYKNITGSNGVVPPNLDTTNWEELAYSETNGYIVEIDYINYESTTNYITSRTDTQRNQVEYFDNGTICSLNVFLWGKKGVNQNKVWGNGLFYCCNSIINKTLSNNFVFNAQVYLQGNGTSASLFDTFNDNIFWNSTRIMTITLYDLSAFVKDNEFREVNGIADLKIGANVQFQRNSFVLGSIAVCSLENLFFRNNSFNNSTLLIDKKGGLFEDNFFNSSSIQINGSTGTESRNVLNNSTIILSANEGSVTLNNLSDSVLNIQNNDPTGVVTRNYLKAKSTILVSTLNSGTLGDGGVKGTGNVFDNSLLEIGTLGAGKQIFGNEFYQSQITMGTMQGSFFGCYVKASVITFDSCTGYLFNGLTLHDAQFGNNTYVVPQSFVGGEFIFGNNSIGVKLDCSNPAIYDAGLQQLTIPSELAFFVGVITLTNAGGITIKNVLGVSGLSSTTFFNDAGVTTFVSVAVGVALAGEIVSNQPAPHNFNINYRLNGTDYIRLKLLGSVNVVTETGIFV